MEDDTNRERGHRSARERYDCLSCGRGFHTDFYFCPACRAYNARRAPLVINIMLLLMGASFAYALCVATGTWVWGVMAGGSVLPFFAYSLYKIVVLRRRARRRVAPEKSIRR